MKTIAIAAALTASAPAAAETPLAPSGKWSVDYGEASCALAREYGTGPERMTVAFKPSPLDDDLEIVMVSARAGLPYRKTKAKLILQPGGRAVDSEIELFGVKAKNQTVATLTAKGDAAAALESATALTVEAPDGIRRSIAVPGIKAGFGALRMCQADLLKSWGVDPDEREKVRTPAATIGSPALWLSNDDYPTDAFKARAQGTSVIIWRVNTAGRVEDCKAVKSSGTPSLDQAACKTTTSKGRYKPALGTDGKPMAVHRMRSVVWRLPD